MPVNSLFSQILMGFIQWCPVLILMQLDRVEVGGELGKRLLTTAQDVMLTENLPLLSADMQLGDAIILVSKR